MRPRIELANSNLGGAHTHTHTGTPNEKPKNGGLISFFSISEQNGNTDMTVDKGSEHGEAFSTPPSPFCGVI